MLKLFVWEGFSPDYTDGLAFAIAKNETEAIQMIITELGYNPPWWGELKVYTTTKRIGKGVAGGG